MRNLGKKQNNGRLRIPKGISFVHEDATPPTTTQETVERRRVSGICETTQNRIPHQSPRAPHHSLDGVSAPRPVALPAVSEERSERESVTRRCLVVVGGAGRKLACCNMSFVVPVKEPQRMEYQLPPPPVAAPGLGGNGAHQVPVGVMQGTLTPHVQAQDEQHRWTQYQQLWRQHVYMNGTSHTLPTRDHLLLVVRSFVAMRCLFQEQGH